MSFLITGFGRSGTKFLSTVMNRSEKYTVKHEPRGRRDLGKDPSQFSYEDIFVGNYGEVNGMMRRRITDINNIKKGIILRSPYEIFLSAAMNRKPKSRWNYICEHIINSYLLFDEYIRDLDMFFINFHLMTTDVKYLNDILAEFDICDVKIDKKIIHTKINQNKNIKYFEVPEEFRNKLSILDVIIEKYQLIDIKEKM